MIFLIEYDRNRGEVVTITTFRDWERSKADEARLTLEVELHQLRKEHEVVVLEATTEEELRRTHRRYFESLGELATDPEHQTA